MFNENLLRPSHHCIHVIYVIYVIHVIIYVILVFIRLVCEFIRWIKHDDQLWTRVSAQHKQTDDIKKKILLFQEDPDFCSKFAEISCTTLRHFLWWLRDQNVTSYNWTNGRDRRDDEPRTHDWAASSLSPVTTILSSSARSASDMNLDSVKLRWMWAEAFSSSVRASKDWNHSFCLFNKRWDLRTIN